MGMEKNKLVDKKVYVKWYNLAKETVGDKELIPERSEENIFNLISKENWLMFCPKEMSREEAIQRPEANIFLDILSKEGNLTGFGRLGLTFNNLGAYEKFKTIMSRLNKDKKDEITNKLLGLEYDWNIEVLRKIKKNHSAQTPDYFPEKEFSTKDINERIISDLIKTANDIREQGIKKREEIRFAAGNPKKFYAETPTINRMGARFPLDEGEFKDRILEIFGILTLCLGVKSNVEINKITRANEKRIKELKEDLGALEKDLPKDKKLGIIVGMTEEKIKEKEQKIKEIKEKISKLDEENN